MAIVGQATVVVRALADTFKSDLRRAFSDAETDADKSGGAAGGRFGKRFSSEAGKGVGGVDTGGLEQSFDQAGERSSARFIDRFRARYKELNQLRLDGLESAGGASGEESGSRYSKGFTKALGDGRPLSEVGHLFDELTALANGSGDSAGTGFSGALERGVKDGMKDAERSVSDAGDNMGRNLKAIKIDLPDIGGGLAAKVVALVPLIGLLGGALAAVVGGLTAMASAAVFASGSLAILATGITGLALGGITAFLAFGGIGKALSALGQQQANSGKNALAAAKQHQSAADAIVAAQDRIVQAQRRLRDAEYALADARKRAAQDAKDDAQAIVDAEDAVAQAQKDAKAAQEALTQARKDAQSELEDLQLQLRGAVLSEEESVIRLHKAQAAYQKVLNDPSATADERKQAEIDLEQAELAVDEAKKRQVDVEQKAQDANKKGIEGSDQVVKAKDNINTANKRVATTERDLAKARQRQRDDQVNDARTIVRAQESVSDAIKELAKAHRDLARAEKDAGTAGAAGADKVAAAFKGLSPQAAAFARYLFSLKPLLTQLKAAAGEQLFGPLTTAVKLLVSKLFPVLLTAVRETGAGLGHFFTELSKGFTSAGFLKNLASIAHGLSAVNKQTGTSTWGEFGRIVGNIFKVVVGLANAALPLFQRFVHYISGFTGNLASSFEGLDRDGKPKIAGITKTINRMGDAAATIGHIFGQAFGIIKDVIRAALPSGLALNDSFLKTLTNFHKFTSSAAGQNRIKKFFEAVIPPFKAVAHFVATLAKEFLKLGEDPGKKGKGGGLTKFIDGLTKTIPKIGKFIKDVTAGIGEIATSKSFIAIAQTLNLIAHAIASVVKYLGGDSPVAKFAKAILALAAAFVILKKAANITGITAGVQSLKVGKAPVGTDRAKRASGLGAAIQGARGNRVVDKDDRLLNRKGKAILNDRGEEQGKRTGANRLGASLTRGGRASLRSEGAPARAGRGAALAGVAVIGAQLAPALLSGNIKGVGDAAKAIGKNLTDNMTQYMILAGPAIAGGIGKGLSAVKDAGGLTSFIKGNALKVGDKVGPVFGKIGSIAKGFGGVMRSMGTALYAALGPVGLIIIGIAALVAGLIYAYKHSKTFRDIVDKIGRALKSFGEAIVKYAVEAFKFLKKHIQIVLLAFGPLGITIAAIIFAFKHFDQIKKIVGDVLGAVVGFFKDLPGKIFGFLKDIIVKIATWYIDFYAYLFTKVYGVIKSVIGFFQGMPGQIYNFLKDIIVKAATFVTNLQVSLAGKVLEVVNNVVGFFRALPGRVLAFAGSLGSAALSLANQVGTYLRNKISGFIGDVVNFFKGLPGRIGAFAGSLASAAGGLAGKIASGLKNGVSSAVDSVVGYVKGIPGKLAGLAGTITNAGKSVGTWLVNGIKALAGGAIGLVKAPINALLDGVRGVLHALGSVKIHVPGIPHVFGGFDIGIPDVSKYVPKNLALGATILPRTGGTLVNVGEAGRPESVVDTGLINARLARDDKLVSELQRVRAILERIQQMGGINIEKFESVVQPGEKAEESVPRGLRKLAFELAV